MLLGAMIEVFAKRFGETPKGRAMMIRFVAVLALAAALVGCGGPESPAPATRTEPVATGVAYQHVPSGMLFPPKIGGFERTNVYPGRAGSDGVTVGYAFLTPSGPMLVTVTIEASPPGSVDAEAIDPACREVFERRKADIGTSNAQVKWIEEKDVALRLAGETQPMMTTAFDFEFRGEPMRGYLYLACHVGGAWSLHYRATAPRDPKMAEIVTGFVAALPGGKLHPAASAEVK